MWLHAPRPPGSRGALFSVPKLRSPAFLALAATTVLIAGGASIYHLLTRPLPFDAEVWAKESSWKPSAYSDWLGLPTRRQRMVEELRDTLLVPGTTWADAESALGEPDQGGLHQRHAIGGSGESPSLPPVQTYYAYFLGPGDNARETQRLEIYLDANGSIASCRQSSLPLLP